MYYWINTSLEYQATNEHFDCIVVSQNICIRDYQQIDMFFLHYSVFKMQFLHIFTLKQHSKFIHELSFMNIIRVDIPV